MVICYPLGSDYGMKFVPVTVIGDGDGKKFVSWGWLWYSNNRCLMSPFPQRNKTVHLTTKFCLFQQNSAFFSLSMVSNLMLP